MDNKSLLSAQAKLQSGAGSYYVTPVGRCSERLQKGYQLSAMLQCTSAKPCRSTYPRHESLVSLAPWQQTEGLTTRSSAQLFPHLGFSSIRSWVVLSWVPGYALEKYDRGSKFFKPFDLSFEMCQWLKNFPHDTELRVMHCTIFGCTVLVIVHTLWEAINFLILATAEISGTCLCTFVSRQEGLIPKPRASVMAKQKEDSHFGNHKDLSPIFKEPLTRYEGLTLKRTACSVAVLQGVTWPPGAWPQSPGEVKMCTQEVLKMGVFILGAKIGRTLAIFDTTVCQIPGSAPGFFRGAMQVHWHAMKGVFHCEEITRSRNNNMPTGSNQLNTTTATEPLAPNQPTFYLSPNTDVVASPF